MSAEGNGSKPWVVQLNLDAIKRAAEREMNHAHLHLQLILEESARGHVFSWLGLDKIAYRLGKRPMATARKIVRSWEEAGYGRRVLEGKGNQWIGVVLFYRLDPKMPAATPETFEAACQELRAAKSGETPVQNSTTPCPNQHNPLVQISTTPLSKSGEPPCPDLDNIISTHPESARSAKKHSRPNNQEGRSGVHAPFREESRSPEDQRVMGHAQSRWGDDGRECAIDLLMMYPASVVSHAADVAFDWSKGMLIKGFAPRVRRYWRGACENHKGGPLKIAE